MVASYTVTGESFRVEKPRLWSERYHEGDMTRRGFDLHPDGKRFVLSPVARTPNDAKVGTLVVVSNFFDELRRVAPPPPRR